MIHTGIRRSEALIEVLADAAPNCDRYESIVKYLQQNLSQKRFQHCLRVAELTSELSSRFGVSGDKGFLAGLCHDICREMTSAELETLVQGEILFSWEQESPIMLHARAGAVLMKREFGITDEEVLQSVRDHITGRPGMGILSSVLYVADYLEPGRKFHDPKERETVLQGDLNSLVRYVSASIISYLEKKGKQVMGPIRELLGFSIVGSG